VLKIYCKYSKDSSWTIDIWTGLGQNEFAGYTAHWIDENWVLRRAVLDLDYFPEAHTGENIRTNCEKISVKYDSAMPFQIVSDSGANVVLGKKLFLQKDGITPSFHFLFLPLTHYS
jgi:hypothetical protein